MKQDKILHFLAGYGICATATLVAPLWAALLIVLTIAATKELYDTQKANATGFDLLDLFVTVCGGVAWAVILALVN